MSSHTPAGMHSRLQAMSEMRARSTGIGLTFEVRQSPTLHRDVELTAQQVALLDVMEQHGPFPSLRALLAASPYRSLSGLHRAIGMLRKLGFVCNLVLQAIVVRTLRSTTVTLGVVPTLMLSIPKTLELTGSERIDPDVIRGSQPTTYELAEPRMDAEERASWRSFRAEAWSAFTDAWLRRGFLRAPEGSPDDDNTSQRGLLWTIADARPNDLARWVREAPPGNRHDVIEYVLDQWHAVRDAVPHDDEVPVVVYRSRWQGVGRMLGTIAQSLGIEPPPVRAEYLAPDPARYERESLLRRLPDDLRNRMLAEHGSLPAVIDCVGCVIEARRAVSALDASGV